MTQPPVIASPSTVLHRPDQTINTGGDASFKLLEGKKPYHFINGKFDKQGIQVLRCKEKIREL